MPRTFLVSQESPSSPGEKFREEELRAAVEAYYEAVAYQNWNYAYDNLDSHTKQKYIRDEYVSKNQYLVGVDPLAQISAKITSGISTSSPVEVRLDQTFQSGATRSRTTQFVWDDGSWKHRFTPQEYDILLPDTSYEEFVIAKQSGS